MNTMTIASAAHQVSTAAAEKETVKGFEILSNQELFVLSSIGSIKNDTPVAGYGAKQHAFDFAHRVHGFSLTLSSVEDALEALLKAGLIKMTSDIDAKLTPKAEKLMFAAAKELSAA